MTRLRPDWVAADLDSFANGRNGDDNLQVLLKFEDRPKGMLWASGVAADGLPQVGGLEWSQEHPNHMTFTKFGRPKTLPTRSGPVATAPVNAAKHPELLQMNPVQDPTASLNPHSVFPSYVAVPAPRGTRAGAAE